MRPVGNPSGGLSIAVADASLVSGHQICGVSVHVYLGSRPTRNLMLEAAAAIPRRVVLADYRST